MALLRAGVYRALAVKDVHIVVGCLALGLNLLAFLFGAVAWWRKRPSPWFWWLLRGGQAMVVVEAVLGGVLLLMGRKASDLHLLYGVLPLVVALIAEQLKLSAATHGARRARTRERPGGRSSADERATGDSGCRSCGARSGR